MGNPWRRFGLFASAGVLFNRGRSFSDTIVRRHFVTEFRDAIS
jgi:hypothetical protein